MKTRDKMRIVYDNGIDGRGEVGAVLDPPVQARLFACFMVVFNNNE